MRQVDAIVIGSGQGGVPLAVKLSYQGKSVVLLEKKALGGSCLNYGCYPSKAFLGAAHTAGNTAYAARWGIDIQQRIDFHKLMERVRGKRDSAYIKKSLERAGVTIIYAEASFTGERTLAAGGEEFTADMVVIDTGNAPFVPPITGLAGTPFMTYLDFWDMDELPPRIIIVGGGYVGVELGQGLARLGCETTIVEAADRIMAREEADLSQTLQAVLAADGVGFHLGRQAESVTHGQGVFRLSLDNGDLLQAEALLVAVGQQGSTGALNLPATGVELHPGGYVKVNDRFETTCPGIFAIGDVTGQPAFTHVAWEDHRRLLSILEGGSRRQGDRVLGYAVYTDPECGRCGMTLAQAEAAGISARAVTLKLEHVARAWLVERDQGFYRLVVENETDKILGATLAGPRAGELVHVIIDLMEVGATWRQLEQAVHIHPTFAEGLPTLARQLLENKARGLPDNPQGSSSGG